MTTAREEILRRIRAALADVPSDEQPEHVVVERGFNRASDAARSEIVDLFVERVTEYQATAHRVSETDLPQAIAAACASRGVRRLVVPADVPDEWMPEGAAHGIELLRDGPGRELAVDELNASDAALTGCALGIAQTGSIVLDSGPAQGRRAITLVPDCHLCVMREDQIVGIMPEAITHLGDAVRARRPITVISGPSATVDIEFQRVKGVHGPRTLEVFVVAATPAASSA